MAQLNQPQLAGTTHLNNGLFSDYYLDTIIPDSREWTADNDLFAEAKQVKTDLLQLLESIDPATLDEAQLEEQWIKPVLDALGHHYAVQVKIRYRESGHRKPDYLLLETDEQSRAITNEIYTPEDIQHALAVADAKKWGVKLDRAAKCERNPPVHRLTNTCTTANDAGAS